MAHTFAVHGPGSAGFYMRPFLNGREKKCAVSWKRPFNGREISVIG
jgi:hypothetical protein